MAEIRGLLSVCDKQLHYGNQIISRGLSSVKPSLALDYSHQKGPHSRRVAGLSSLFSLSFTHISVERSAHGSLSSIKFLDHAFYLFAETSLIEV